MAFLNALPGAVAQGLIWGLMAIGVYISYKILDIADLTVDGSICTGACVCAVMIGMGVPAWISVLLALLAGALTGVVTGLPLVMFSAGLKTTPMTLAGILMYINPTLQLLVSVLIYHEPFTTTHRILFVFVWVGLALYLASGFLESRKKEEQV